MKLLEFESKQMDNERDNIDFERKNKQLNQELKEAK